MHGPFKLLWITCFALIVSLTGCASHLEKTTLVLDYSDFGPQAMAYPALGPKKLSWQPQIPLIAGQGEIRVVVYRDIGLEELKTVYKVDQDNFVDYRFIEYEDAIKYLDKRIAQNLLARITKQLENTRHTIIERWR